MGAKMNRSLSTTAGREGEATTEGESRPQGLKSEGMLRGTDLIDTRGREMIPQRDTGREGREAQEDDTGQEQEARKNTGATDQIGTTGEKIDTIDEMTTGGMTGETGDQEKEGRLAPRKKSILTSKRRMSRER